MPRVDITALDARLDLYRVGLIVVEAHESWGIDLGALSKNGQENVGTTCPGPRGGKYLRIDEGRECPRPRRLRRGIRRITVTEAEMGGTECGKCHY